MLEGVVVLYFVGSDEKYHWFDVKNDVEKFSRKNKHPGKYCTPKINTFPGAYTTREKYQNTLPGDPLRDYVRMLARPVHF